MLLWPVLVHLLWWISCGNFTETIHDNGRNYAQKISQFLNFLGGFFIIIRHNSLPVTMQLIIFKRKRVICFVHRTIAIFIGINIDFLQKTLKFPFNSEKSLSSAWLIYLFFIEKSGFQVSFFLFYLISRYNYYNYIQFDLILGNLLFFIWYHKWKRRKCKKSKT